MERTNTYGYMALNVNRVPLFVVQIAHKYCAGFYVFSNAKTAQEFTLKRKTTLSQFAPLEYDPDFKFSGTCISALCNPNHHLYSSISNKQVYAYI